MTDNQDQEIDPYRGDGTCEFLSHEKYKKWAGENEDVFKLEVTVTLHTKDNTGDVWKR